MTTENTGHQVLSTGSCCGGGQPAAAAAAPSSAAAGADTAVCPVMTGSTVVKSVAEAQGLFRDYDGNRYWFCCAGCGPAFDADPARYATAV